MENEKKFTGPAYEFEAKMPLKTGVILLTGKTCLRCLSVT